MENQPGSSMTETFGDCPSQMTTGPGDQDPFI
jgi:hypothetical protein